MSVIFLQWSCGSCQTCGNVIQPKEPNSNICQDCRAHNRSSGFKLPVENEAAPIEQQ